MLNAYFYKAMSILKPPPKIKEESLFKIILRSFNLKILKYSIILLPLMMAVATFVLSSNIKSTKTQIQLTLPPKEKSNEGIEIIKEILTNKTIDEEVLENVEP